MHEGEYSATTNNIIITVNVMYLGEQQSINNECYYIWEYNINIHNNKQHTIKLLTRNWEIRDNTGFIENVTGTGVVGEQPILQPQERFQYNSGVYLTTISGVMSGYYEFFNQDLKEVCNAEIPLFSLDSTYCYIRPH